jgi:hypothetical protein
VATALPACAFDVVEGPAALTVELACADVDEDGVEDEAVEVVSSRITKTYTRRAMRMSSNTPTTLAKMMMSFLLPPFPLDEGGDSPEG